MKKQNFNSELIDTIFKYSLDELIVCDENFNILLRNYRFDFKNNNIFNFLELVKEISDTKTMEKVFALKYKEEKTFAFTTIISNSKKQLPVFVLISKISDKTGYFVSVKDITEQISYNVQKENFISTLTHDFKTPIIAQINTLKMLLKSPQFRDNEVLIELFNSCLFLNHITENLLAKYKDNFNSLNVSRSYCDISLIMSKTIDNLSYTLNQKHQVVELKTPKRINLISAVKSEMEMLCDNLLLNAHNNSRTNSKIKISLENNKDGIKIIIRDFGFGAEEDEIKSVFDEYINCANNYQKIAHNLNLQVSRKIVNAYGGEMLIKSKTDKGMRVEINLPLSSSTVQNSNLFFKQTPL